MAATPGQLRESLGDVFNGVLNSRPSTLNPNGRRNGEVTPERLLIADRETLWPTTDEGINHVREPAAFGTDAKE